MPETPRPSKRPLVLAALRKRHWDTPPGEPPRMTKGLLKNLKSLGYTRVRITGPDGESEQEIEGLLR